MVVSRIKRVGIKTFARVVTSVLQLQQRSLPSSGDYLSSILAVLLEFRVSVSGVKTLGITFLVVPVNGGSRVIPLLKAFDGVGTSSRMKTQDLTILVDPDNDGVYAPFPSLRHCFGGAFLELRGRPLWSGCCCYMALFAMIGSFLFLFLVLCFWLCASQSCRGRVWTLQIVSS